MGFKFRQFSLEDERSTQRVGTDAMLLGSWAEPGHAKRILDVGTGCGVLALMLAQRSEGKIEAIEIDSPSVVEARANFLKSPWSARISAIQCSIQSFRGEAESEFDYIITNPPFFSNALKSVSDRKNNTRHDTSLSFNDLILNVIRLLSPKGCFALILPTEMAGKFQQICAENGLYPAKQMIVHPKPNLPPKRILTVFMKTKTACPGMRELAILDASGNFTPEYLSLTGGYHNF